MGAIYAIEHMPSGKKYIGSSVKPKKRKTQHFTDLRGNRHPNCHLQRAFNKYGEQDFEFHVLEESKDLADREKFWILKLDTVSNGYNMTSEPYSPMRGRKHSPKTIQGYRENRKGSKHPRAKIDERVVRRIFDLKDEGLNQGQIALEVGIDRSNVSLILRGKAWSHVGLSIDKPRFNNISGCVGVYFAKKSNKWVAEIIRNKQHKNLGSYVNKEDAIKARKKAEVNCGL